MKILLIYPGATWSPYDVACGVEDALTELGHDVLPFPHHSYYSMFTKTFSDWERRGHALGGPYKPLASMWASRMAIAEAVEFAPDVALVVMGISFHLRAYLSLYALGIPVAIILTESPYADTMQAGMIHKSLARLVFTNEKISAHTLPEILSTVNNRTPVVYLPHSYNPRQHKVMPLDDGLRRQFGSDIFFHGTLWNGRRELLDQVKATRKLRGYNVKITGARFSVEQDKMVDGNLVDNREMAIRYNCTKIAINHHRQEAHGGGMIKTLPYSLGPRAFEIAVCGAFQLSDYRPELRDVFGDTVAVYHDAKDLIAKANYYLLHENEREEMAAAARLRVAKCSFLDRCRDIIVPALEQYLGGTNANCTNHPEGREELPAVHQRLSDQRS